MTHEVEGSHAAVSAQLAKRYGESEGVIHAIEAHHYEVQPQTVEAVLLIAADAISASRPGARGESLEHYIRRLEALEEIATAKPGVAKAYALQAGREIRVMVEPTEVDDDGAVAALARDRARDRGPARVPRPGEGDGDPREPVGRRRGQPVRAAAGARADAARRVTSAQRELTRREALPRDDVRVPDERPRLRADQGHAGVARDRRGDVARRGRRRRVQHLHDPREAGHAARRLPRRCRAPASARTRSS